FNYTQDTWSGATPYGSAPENSVAYSLQSLDVNDDGIPLYTGASPLVKASGYFDNKGNSYTQEFNPTTGQLNYLKNKTVHVMGFASPETRKQGDFKLSYDWDDAAIEAGGGISVERDYESRFVNLGGRLDFNQKQTIVNAGISYTNSAIEANPDITNYARWGEQHANLISTDPLTKVNTLHANREDWAAQLGLTQVVNKDAVVELGMGYTRSTGFLENPYKLSWLFGVDPDDPRQQGLPEGLFYANGRGGVFIEQRPDARDQWRWNTRWTQYVEPLDAALHLGYAFAHDDWGINAHTFDADWVQPLGDGWTVTPRIRYYSQEQADFYATNPIVKPLEETVGVFFPFILPDNFSSDQRLSGYGTLSGGVTVSKEFAKGIRLETGFEYYTHQGSLKLGGGGEDSFADFDYWVANAALKVNLSALGQTTPGSHADHSRHTSHNNIPAGVLFGHTLEKAGDMMVGYRYMRNQQAGAFLHGDQSVNENQILAKACPGSPNRTTTGGSFDGGCTLLPREMTMSMHMLDLMVAPTDWLTLMLMPQFVDMDMDNYQPESLIDPNLEHNHGGGLHDHETGGVGDTGMYALVKLFDRPNHQLHTSLGVTAPTGDVGIRSKLIGLQNHQGSDDAYLHYGMQLGSGTWDFKPSLTYTGKAEDWSWGAQAGGTLRLEDGNKSGYALGDLFETSIWGGYNLTHWLSASVRAAYTWQGAIKGRFLRNTRGDAAIEYVCKRNATYSETYDENGNPGPLVFHQADYNQCLAYNEITKRLNDANDRPNPMDFPRNYGGHYVDIGFGLSATVPSGSLAGNKLSFEWLQPVYTDVNGYQLDRDGALSFTWSYGF
ncbi:MAG: DUF3570 domain-containing protein, partial [Methyloglobulus sp.]|nr:DUF3570 domain-containing protein [Methyloglobulus sp.]